jgi:hypothetical protein
LALKKKPKICSKVSPQKFLKSCWIPFLSLIKVIIVLYRCVIPYSIIKPQDYSLEVIGYIGVEEKQKKLLKK